MSKKLWIHAGGTKAGSSAIQNFCAQLFHKNEELGKVYKNFSKLSNEYSVDSGNGMKLLRSFQNVQDNNELGQVILDYFSTSSSEAIISTENFFIWEDYHWQKLKEICDLLDIELKVIFYIRDWLPFALSSYDQGIKRHGEWRSFREVAVGLKWLHFETLSKLAQVFSKQDLQILSYEKHKHVLIQSFLRQININAMPEFKAQYDIDRVINRSLTQLERKILRRLNKNLAGGVCNSLSDIFLRETPTLKSDFVIEKSDYLLLEDLILMHTSEADWINEKFFQGQVMVTSGTLSNFKMNNQDGQQCDNETMNLFLEFITNYVNNTENLSVQMHLLQRFAKYIESSHSESFRGQLPDGFNPLRYLVLNPELIAAEVDPVNHFVSYGKKEGRRYK